MLYRLTGWAVIHVKSNPDTYDTGTINNKGLSLGFAGRADNWPKGFRIGIPRAVFRCGIVPGRATYTTTFELPKTKY